MCIVLKLVYRKVIKIKVDTIWEKEIFSQKENQYKEIDTSTEENDFLDRKTKNFDVVTSKSGGLDKKCMLNLMKIVGELAELRSKDLIEKN